MIEFSEEPQYKKDGRIRRILPFFEEYPILNATLLRALIGGAAGLDIPRLLVNLSGESGSLSAIAPPMGMPLATRYCLSKHRQMLNAIITHSSGGRVDQSSKGRILHALLEYPILSERLLTLVLRTERIFYFEALNQLISNGEIAVINAPDLRTGRRLYLCRYERTILPLMAQNKSL